MGRGGMKQREASCSCGQLVVAIDGDPIRVSICHCHACQRRTGSVFGAQARFLSSQARVSGNATVYERTGDSGGRTRFHFCPACGATVYYRFGHTDEFIAVPVGAFADKGFPGPVFSVYEERQHPWVRLPDGIEHHP